MAGTTGVGSPSPLSADDDLTDRAAAALERLTTAVRSLLTTTAASRGLSPIQQQALLTISRVPAARRQVKALAAEFGVSQPTMSDALTALERKRLLTRTPALEDARRRELTLTPEGHSVVEEIADWNAPLVDALRRQPTAETAALLQGTLHLIARLYTAGLITVDRSCTTCRFFEPGRHSDRRFPYHCALLDLPLDGSRLRVDCPEHESRPINIRSDIP